MIKEIFLKFKKWFIGLFIISVASASAVGMLEVKEIPDNLKLKSSINQIVNSKQIKDKAGNDIISYDYISDKKTNQKVVFAENDVFSNLVLVKDNGKKFNKPNFKGVVKAYVGSSHFYKDGNGIWEIKHHATTTVKAWKSQTFNWVDKIFGAPALATASTTYAIADDGTAYYGYNASWDTCHDAVVGSGIATGGTADGFSATRYNNVNGGFKIWRMFLPVNTSAFPDDMVVSSSTVYFYILGQSNGKNDAVDYITVVQTSQADPTALTTADYNNCGATTTPTEGIDVGERKDLTSDFTTGVYNTFTLNSTGYGWLDPTGWFLLGIREGHDTTNTTIGASDAYNYIQFYSPERAGQDKDPYITVEYTVPSAPTAIPQPAIY